MKPEPIEVWVVVDTFGNLFAAPNSRLHVFRNQGMAENVYPSGLKEYMLLTREDYDLLKLLSTATVNWKPIEGSRIISEEEYQRLKELESQLEDAEAVAGCSHNWGADGKGNCKKCGSYICGNDF